MIYGIKESHSTYLSFNSVTDKLPPKRFGGPHEARRYSNHFASANRVVECSTGRLWIAMSGYHDAKCWREVPCDFDN